MVYSPNPPYEILQTRCIDFATMQHLRRFARHWDLVSNSGNFLRSAPLIWQKGSPFQGFLRFSQWLHARHSASHGISLHRLAEAVFDFLTGPMAQSAAQIAYTVWDDYQQGGRTDRPAFLLKHLPAQSMKIERRPISSAIPKRQHRRLRSPREAG